MVPRLAQMLLATQCHAHGNARSSSMQQYARAQAWRCPAICYAHASAIASRQCAARQGGTRKGHAPAACLPRVLAVL